MKLLHALVLILAGSLTAAAQQPKTQPRDFSEHEGWQQLFDGKTLNGWEGEPQVWRVQDGAIIGEFNTPEGTRNGQTFLVLKDPKPADFELKLEIKLEGKDADSGIQYRSYVAPPNPPRPGVPPSPQHDPRFNLGGYQFDFNFVSCPPGCLAEGGPNGRGVIANLGQMVRAESHVTPRVVAEMGTFDSLASYFRKDDWNEVHIIARGRQITQIINGHVMAILIDDDPAHFRADGLIGLQAAGSGHQKISFRNIWLKEYAH
ncbi:MAG TPA: DUF1080 domain-containing protein [Granulicella sp.]